MYFTQGLHRAVRQQPDTVAVCCGDERLTFAQFAQRVASLAGALRRLGIHGGERVAMLSLNSVRYLEYDMAVPWAGGVLNPVNIRWSPAEMLYALDDSGTHVLIVDDNFKDVASRLAKEGRTVRHVIYAGAGKAPAGMLDYEALIAANEPVEDAWRHGEDLAGIFYTGGTTGYPKGVMLSHYNLGISGMASLVTGRCAPGTVYLHAMPMFHLGSFSSVNALFMNGGVHVVLPSFTPQGVLEAISRYGVNELMLAPTMIQLLLDWMDANASLSGTLDLSSLRMIGYGASPISQALLRRAQATFRNAKFVQGYGMTELSPAGTFLGDEYHTDAAFASGKMRAAGKPYVCVEIKIVDDDGQELPRGEVGEIVARGGNVMRGYWNKPEATAEAIRNGWLHTGDSGYMDEEGLVYVVDRLKDMIVTGAENVYSAEVENALASHPAVAACAVIGIPNQKWGESVHAVVVLRAGASVAEAALMAHCRERIAGYKCPRSFEFRDTLPLSSVGKVLKTELRKPYWDGQGRNVA
ncbi:long-chain-fatty-acid--CoA ligase [Cupriavidus oxalaticus]|uniref:Long-chain-fatty-acid--CoA ligase n=1 Tax=Cupriavidus oxalaticus TaxID=96344 RepID=A0A4P7LNW9_9BURK|nr:long-chain-fatty-acid--CoA ligase [Cupriavidus oxalaticus]QBY55393.1 long-chain-fatty-acid--CoA ligase [Cupriavidus oxalaticus]